jgi:hypothetical protein
MSRVFIATLLCGGLVLSVWSCQREEGAEGEQMEETTATAEVEEIALPNASGAALWRYLEAVDYRANWELWPDKGELYVGQEPHGVLLTTYLNPAAEQALASMAGSMPAGAIIVKENYMPDSTLAAVTVMYKVEGYYPTHKDWFWLKRLADGTTEVEGRAAGCIACHSAQANNDYIFTGSLTGGM